MKPFVRIVNPGTIKIGNRNREVFCSVKYDKKGRLSISGVVGPWHSGNCAGGCGQITDHLSEISHFHTGWDGNILKQFVGKWLVWHLNDMHPGCIHQEADTKFQKKTQDQKLKALPCPVCGYKWGSEWQKREVPNDVLQFLKALPEAKKKPAWV